MSIRIGIYDFFAHMLPGVFYLLVAGYGLVVFGFIPFDLTLLKDLSLFAFIILVSLGYIAGLLLDPLAFLWSTFFIGRNGPARAFAFETFRRKHPWVELNFAPDDWVLLLGAVKAKSLDLALEIEQNNVTNIMLRNISLGLAFLAVIYLLFFVSVTTNPWNLVLAGICAGFSIVAIRRSWLRRHWFYLGILETFAVHYLLQDEWGRHLAPVDQMPAASAPVDATDQPEEDAALPAEEGVQLPDNHPQQPHREEPNKVTQLAE